MTRIVLEKMVCQKCNRELIRLSGEEYYIVSIIGDRACEHEYKKEILDPNYLADKREGVKT